MTDIDLVSYVYWEYSVAVLLVTEVIRTILADVHVPFIQNIVTKRPKWITLIVAILLSVADRIFISQSFHLWQFIISFGLAVLGYDYGLKILKERIFTPMFDWIKSFKENR